MARREVATRGKKPAARRRPATRSNLPILSRRECISWLLVAVAGLSLAGLRMHVIRLRYALGRAAREEQRLAARQRAARATLAALRDPKRLTELARARGYGPPERILRVGERGPQR